MLIETHAIVLLMTTVLQVGGVNVTEPVSNTLTEFGTTVANALPSVIAALILLGIGYVIGRIVGWVVGKVTKTLNVDKYWKNSGIGQATTSSGWNMSKILSTAAKWFIYLFFIAAAVNVLGFTQVADAINNVWLWIPNVIAFVIILVVGSLIVDFVGKWMQRELPKRGIMAGKTIALVMSGILYAIVLTVAVTQLGIGEEILNSVITALVWSLAAVIAIGFGVGLAYGLKEVMPSAIMGSTVIQPALKQGQKISVDGKSGTVQQVGAFSVVLKDGQGKTIVIPTKMLMDKEIVVESGPTPETQERVAERSSSSAEAA